MISEICAKSKLILLKYTTQKGAIKEVKRFENNGTAKKNCILPFKFCIYLNLPLIESNFDTL